jgi:hypothetical protein
MVQICVFLVVCVCGGGGGGGGVHINNVYFWLWVRSELCGFVLWLPLRGFSFVC